MEDSLNSNQPLDEVAYSGTSVSPSLESLKALPDTFSCILNITKHYSQGNHFLSNIPAENLAYAIGLDIDTFCEEDWEFSRIPNDDPDEDYLNSLQPAHLLACFFDEDRNLMLEKERYAELKIILDKSKAGVTKLQGELIDALSLEPEEVDIALEGATFRILEGNEGWAHLCEIKFTGMNEWVVGFAIIQDESGREVSFEIYPPN